LNCLDCNTHEVERVALAICRRYGAGVCADHADVLEPRLETLGPIVIPRRSEHRARRVLCLVCHRAEQELVPPRPTGRRTRRAPNAQAGT